MLTVTPYAAFDEGAWDELVAAAPMGTFLHTRRFLGYHGDRFEDVSLVLRDGDGRMRGVLPAAVDPADPKRVASHPGATYGGIVHDGSVAGPAMIDAVSAVAAHLRERGFERLGYAAVPWIYHRQPSNDDLYALFRLRAARSRCDLASAIDVGTRSPPSASRRRGIARAERAGVEVAQGPALVGELWPVIEENLATRHGARPVHTAAQIGVLIELFPEAITVLVARYDGNPVAGAVLFHSPCVVHAQYIASTAAATDVRALDLVLERGIGLAVEAGARFFDFGTSNREAGRVLNAGLFRYKHRFGAGGVAYEQYELDLTQPVG